MHKTHLYAVRSFDLCALWFIKWNSNDFKIEKISIQMKYSHLERFKFFFVQNEKKKHRASNWKKRVIIIDLVFEIWIIIYAAKVIKQPKAFGILLTNIMNMIKSKIALTNYPDRVSFLYGRMEKKTTLTLNNR